MNLVKLANPVHAAREAAGLAGTVTGAAGTVVGRAVGAGREVLHRVATAAEGTADDLRRHAPDRPVDDRRQDAGPRRGADTVAFPPQPPAEPPVDVVGEALSGEEGPVTEGGAVVVERSTRD